MNNELKDGSQERTDSNSYHEVFSSSSSPEAKARLESWFRHRHSYISCTERVYKNVCIGIIYTQTHDHVSIQININI